MRPGRLLVVSIAALLASATLLNAVTERHMLWIDEIGTQLVWRDSEALAFIEVVVLAGRHWVTGAESTRGALDTPRTGNVQALARSLFTDFLWPFELTAALLVIAVVGGVVLARRSGQKGERLIDEPAADEATEDKEPVA